jgi:PAS domain S-box-containing protein
MRSLEWQLPVAAFILLALVATSVTVLAYRDVDRTTRALYGERLLRLDGQLVTVYGPAVLGARDALARAATQPAVIRALTDPGSVEDGAAVMVLGRVLPEALGNVAIGAWDLAGDLVVNASPAESPPWLMVAPPLADTPSVTPLVAEGDTLFHYGVVAPVRSGRQLVGFLHVRQRIGRGAAGAAALGALVDESARILIGSPGGAWTDLVGAVEGPPLELLDAESSMAYERGGVRRLGVGRLLPGTELALVVEQEEAVVTAPTRAFLRRLGLVATLAVLIASAAAWWLGRRMTLPLRHLQGAAEGLGRGDYARRAVEAGHHEIAGVARTFNKMASETEAHVRALEESEQRFRSLVTATTQIVWWTDPEGNIAQPLPSWQSYTGLSFEKTRGSGWTMALHHEDAASALETWREAVRSRSLYEAEYRIRRHDGAYRWFVVRFIPVLERDGSVREWVGTGTDVTEQRQTELKLKDRELELQQAQRLDAIGRLAGGIAHDFNNLLTTILVPADLAQRALPADDPLQKDLADIRSGARRASELTKKLLAFGKQQVLSPTLIDVNGAVEAAIRLLGRVIGESIVLEFSPGAEEATVVVDPTQFEQVIMNLALNARDAMPLGGKLTIETADAHIDRAAAEEHPGLKPGRYVALSVTDTGSGMDRETQARIFEPFYSTKGDDKGTGLGLAIVYGIVRQSGGHVLLHTEPGQGACFKILLPFASHPTRHPAKAPRPAAARDEAPTGTETILLAEDEEAIRRLAVRILSGLGYRVITAAGGDEALRLAAGHAGPIDILVTDVVMPGMNGLELWERLRAERPSVSALFLSGWASTAVVRHGILDGQIPFLQKPFSAFELGSRVRDVLDAVRLRHELPRVGAQHEGPAAAGGDPAGRVSLGRERTREQSEAAGPSN